jgi:hypothetical protein
MMIASRNESLHSTVDAMKTPPVTSGFTRFTTAARDILQVSKTEMQTRIEEHRESWKSLTKGR